VEPDDFASDAPPPEAPERELQPEGSGVPPVPSLADDRPPPDNGPVSLVGSVATPPLGAQRGVRRIGKYELVEELGESPVGRVFKCFDREADRYVAVKVPRGKNLAPNVRDQFLDQAERAAEVQHENVCPVYEVGLDGARPFIVTPFIEGETLTWWMRRNRLMAVPELLTRVLGLARGLSAIHAAGIIHRDLKPDNVLVDGERFLIMDHGWPQMPGAAVHHYMAPEQLRATGRFQIGERSDVFSLGVILYELLTGAHPFPWLTAEVLARGVTAWSDKVRAPSEAAPGLDPRVNPLCVRALEPAPNDRYATAAGFADEIDKCRWQVASGRLMTAEADFKAGEAYYYGAPGIPRDTTRARKLFERAAGQGYAPAQNSLGCLYQHALGVPRDYTRARELYEKAAEQWNARAQNNLGYMYLKGLGVPRDYEKARELYEKAAEQGDAAGQYNLGTLYMHAMGVEQDYDVARELYLRAAEQGFAKAQNGLGFMYLEALGVDQNYELARHFFEKAAEQLFGLSQASLGYIYLKGLGVDPDFETARMYFEKAAQQGVAQAYNGLGYMYQYGLTVAQDFTKARELFVKAAKKGLAEAIYNLGYMFHHGLGVRRDPFKAYELYEKAAARGDEDAIEALQKLADNDNKRSDRR
jgi:TPR repeat protein